MKEDAKKYLQKCKECTHKLQQDSKKIKLKKEKKINNEYTRVRYDDFFQGSRILDKLLRSNQEIIKKEKKISTTKKNVKFLLQFSVWLSVIHGKQKKKKKICGSI